MPDEVEDEESRGARPFWSGTVSFGLLSLPVHLYVSSRRNTIALRMLDEDGTPLSRRYFCSKDEEPLDSDELARGYEVNNDKYIKIEDDELEALAPEKSREINLRRFVPLDDIDPMYFERAYFLVPEEGAQKAYALLARSMESQGRAGIASFVMRGKEYLVAIISGGGILRAETLRFHDELRTPEDIGLPSLTKANTKDATKFKKQIAELSTGRLNLDELADDTADRLHKLVEKKLAEGEDVVHPPNLPKQETAEVIDLMQVLKQSLEGKTEPTRTNEDKGKQRKPKHRKRRSAEAKQRKRPPKIDPHASKAELYEIAKQLDIPGRSQMSKNELLKTLRQ